MMPVFRPRRLLRGGAAVALVAALVQGCTSENVTGIGIGNVRVSPSSSSVVEGLTVRFQAEVRDVEGQAHGGTGVLWSSDDEEVAVVDQSGLATALQPGTTTIRARFEDAEGVAELRVEPGPSIRVFPSTVASHAGVGGAPLDPIELEVRNAGAGDLGTLAIEVTHPDGGRRGWLEAELEGTRAPAGLRLAIDPGALPAGEHRASVVVTSSAPDQTPRHVPVTLFLAGFRVEETDGGSRVDEDGGVDSLLVALDARPAGEVVLRVESDDESEVTVDPAELVFSPGNWDETQVVRLRGVEDGTADGDQTTEVTVHVVPERSHPTWEGAPSRSVEVVSVDVDEAGFLVTETGDGTVVDESGTTDTVHVSLPARPPGPVVIVVEPSSENEIDVQPREVSFGPDDWADPRPVVVTGRDDDVVDGPVETDVLFRVDEGRSHPSYHGLPARTVVVTTLDDDGAELVVRESGDGSRVSEDGDTDAFTVSLSARPSADVVVLVESLDPSEVEVSPDRLVFTPANWDVAQPVTLRGVDDDEVDGDTETEVVVAVDPAASAEEYRETEPVSVVVVNVDDDLPGLVVVEAPGGTTAVEGGPDGSFTVALAAAPASPVEVTVRSEDPDEVTVSPERLTFGPDSWSVPQEVVVRAVDDDLVDGEREVEVTVAVDPAASDDAWDAVEARTVVVRTTDDEVAGFSLLDEGGAALDGDAIELPGGGTTSFSVVLDGRPVSEVAFTVVSADTTIATVDSARVQFGSADWSTPRVITVRGMDAEGTGGARQTTIEVAVDVASSDGAFADLPPRSLSVTVEDGAPVDPGVPGGAAAGRAARGVR